VGAKTFARVNDIIKAEGISKQEAFERVGKELKSNRGAVAANYYRVAKAQRATPPSRQRPGSTSSPSSVRATRTTPAGRATKPSLDDIADELTRSISALVQAVKQQNREVTQLRTRLDGVRSLLRLCRTPHAAVSATRPTPKADHWHRLEK